MHQRGFDFRQDYVVINLLGQTLIDRARKASSTVAERTDLLQAAVEQFHRTLAIDAENEEAHFGLQQAYALLGDPERAAKHRRKHLEYKLDDNARDVAFVAARRRYPAANHAAEAVVIYDLQRDSQE